MKSARTRLRFAAAAFAALLAASCSSEKGTPAPDDSSDPFVVGATRTRALDIAPGGAWRDPVSDLRFVFPAGATGTITVGSIVDGPARPWAGGAGFRIAYDGEEPVWMRVANDAGGYACLLAWGVPRGSWNDGRETRWFALPRVPAVRSDSIDFRLATRPRGGSEACEASQNYWRFALATDSAEWTAFQARIATARSLVAAWLDSLDEPLRETCRARVEGDLAPDFYPDGDYYAGFFRACGEAPIPAPRLGLATDAVAHVVGHYVTHVLAGDATYAALEADAGLDPTIGAPRPGRAGLIEDYARFHEYLLTGAIAGAGDPADPSAFFPAPDAISPERVDVPALQGYGVLLLHALTRADTLMTALDGPTLSVPAIGLDYPTLAGELIARGARTSGELRAAAEEFLATRGQADRVPSLAAATGWRYGAVGRVLDRAGHPARGLAVRGVSRIDGRDYASPGPVAHTDSAGTFVVHGLPGGPCALRVGEGADAFYAPLSILPSKATTTGVDLQDLTAWGYLSSMDNLRIRLTLRFATEADTLLPFEFNQALADSHASFTADRITLDDPFTWSCAPPAGPRDCWVLDSLDIHYDLSTGLVDRLGVRVHDQSDSPVDFALRLRRPLQAVMSGAKRVYFAKMLGVGEGQARDAFACELRDRAGARYTEADLRGSALWIEVRAYCG